MNIFTKLGCRIYQKTFKVATSIMPWRRPEIIEGGLKGIPALLENNNINSILLVTDSMLMGLGMVTPLIDDLNAKNIKVTIYDKVIPNPTINVVEEALEYYHNGGCQAVIAFGGGSPMDCAKTVCAKVARPNMKIQAMKGIGKVAGLVNTVFHAKEIYKGKGKLRVLQAFPLLIAVPTTAGTGSETTLAAVISNSETHEKYPIEDFLLIPRYAVLDPVLTVKLPQFITATTGMDALTHAVEAYIGHSNTKETRECAREAVKLIFANIKTAYDHGDNMEARSNMQNASFLAGVAFNRAYVGYVHALAHALGGKYGTPHGLANSVLLPFVLEAFGSSCHKELAELADLIEITNCDDTIATKANKFIAAIKEYNKYMNIPERILDKTGNGAIKDEDIPFMVKNAYHEGNPLYPVPKLFGKKELTALYKKVQ